MNDSVSWMIRWICTYVPISLKCNAIGIGNGEEEVIGTFACIANI